MTKIELINFLNDIIIRISSKKEAFTNKDGIYFVKTSLEADWFDFIAKSHYTDFHYSLSDLLQTDYILLKKFEYCQAIIFAALKNSRYKNTIANEYKKIQMTYNANCTELAIVTAFDGALLFNDESLHNFSFSGFGRNIADLVTQSAGQLKLKVYDSSPHELTAGPLFEVKDYLNHYTLEKYQINFHNANDAFVHFVGEPENYNNLYIISRDDKRPKLLPEITLNYPQPQIKINGYTKDNKIIDLEYWRHQFNEKFTSVGRTA